MDLYLKGESTETPKILLKIFCLYKGENNKKTRHF